MKLFHRAVEQSAFVVRNPGIIPRLAGNYFKILLGRTPLRTVDLTNTYACNLSCSHCYATGLESKQHRRAPLSWEQRREVIDRCIREGAIHFNIIGGEPTLDKNLFRLIAYIKSKRAIVSIATNGNFLTREYVRKLIDAGLDVALISIDSLDDTPDNYHGDPRKTGALAGLENCRELGLKAFVSTLITPKILETASFEKLLAFCEERGLLLHVNLPTLYGEWDHKEEMLFTEEQKERLEQVYAKRSVRACEMSSYFLSECRTGVEKLHLSLYGDVMPCAFVPVHFGNVLEEDLAVIRQRMVRHPLFAEAGPFCMPSTNRRYQEFFRTRVSGNPLPVDARKL